MRSRYLGGGSCLRDREGGSRTSVGTVAAALLASFAFAAGAGAQVIDIADPKVGDIVGPGTVSLMTKGDTMFKFGALVRMIPTGESNWDFGAGSKAGGAGGTQLLKQHVNEAGWVFNSYVRSEDRLYFSAMASDQSWSFYSALEFDRPLETASVDERGGKLDTSSDFGLERLLATVKLPWNNRLYAGWDVWGVDVGRGRGFIYGDDNPGVWIKGDAGPAKYSVGWFKLKENNFQNQITFNLNNNSDRDLYGGYVDFDPAADNRLRLIYLLDSMNGVAINTLARTFSQPARLAPLGTSRLDNSNLGAIWEGKFGNLTAEVEGAYQFGSAKVTGLPRASYKVRAYALGADLVWNLKPATGSALTAMVGFMYTSGDKSAADGKLAGYSPVTDLQRFGKWGGEELITTDTNLMLGTPLYGVVPTGLGNGTPVVTGGIQNLVGAGFGRGDNPGVRSVNVGFNYSPMAEVLYKAKFSGYWWNEDQVVTSWVNGTTTNTVGSGYVGLEWSNDVAWKINKVTTIKAQATVYFPGSGLKRLLAATTATPAGLGPVSAKVATRIGSELVWSF